MIRVIIVDDDVEMLNGLKNIIDWEKHGFEIVGQADNGLDALGLAKQKDPHVILTDITMPSMDGLELLREVKKFKPHVKSVILTCHQDFNFAREAIELEADFYLVKYMLTSEELVKTMLKVREKIEKEMNRNEVINRVNRELNLNRCVLKEKLIKDILANKYSKQEEIHNKAQVLGIQLPDGPYRVVGVFIDNFRYAMKACAIKENSLLSFAVQNILEDIFRDKGEISCFCLSEAEYAIITGDNSSDRTIKQKLIDCVLELQKNIYRILKVQVSACISGVYGDIKLLESAVSGVKLLRESYFYRGKGFITKERIAFKNEGMEQLYEFFINELKTAVISAEKDSLARCTRRFFGAIESNLYNPDSVRKIFRKIEADIQSLANKKGIFLEDFNLDGDTFDNYKEVFSSALGGFYEKLTGITDTSYRKEINKVLDYIEKNLESNITCEAMAEYVNMNSSYFSRLFKNQVGISFSEYILKIRLERATALMTETELTAVEISKAVGFENVSYFYRLYKKATGKTTGEIRKQGSGSL